MDFDLALTKLVTALDKEEIEYMLVGGYAMSFYNRYRYTADIDCVLLMHPQQVDELINHFPEWKFAAKDFESSAKRIGFFNLTDFESGVRFDFILYSVTDYNWTAYQRKKKVVTEDGTICFISSPEDLVIAKLKWAQASGSQRQLDDIKFLVDNLDLDREYLSRWTNRLLINTYGLF
jgi:hypothetical protein